MSGDQSAGALALAPAAPAAPAGPPAPAASSSSSLDGPSNPLRPRIEQFGRYRLIAEMGHGGMADVFLAVGVGPAGFSKMQVIKRLRSSFADDPELKAMLLDEARLAAQLHHRNIVQTIEVGEADGQYFIAMELLDGQPFSRICRRSKARGPALPLPYMVKILSEALAGLHYAHEAKDYEGHPLVVVHRDVSPQNVFVTYDGQVKVMDFGIAKAARRIVETQTGTVRGKVAYMAPEQTLPKTDDLDRRADVFSVGVILWELLVGERMWGAMGDPEILLKVSSHGARPLPQRPDIPAELARICTRAIARERDHRYATAAEMRADLEAYLEATGAKVSLEELGERVAELFTDDRRRMQKIVERQLAALRTSAIGDDPSTWTGAARTSGAQADVAETNEGSGRNQAMVKPAVGAAARADRGAAGGVSRGWLAAAAILLVAIAVIVMRERMFGAPGGSGPGDTTAAASGATSPASASAPAAAQPAGVAPAADGYIDVRISATPPGARITIDGIAVGSNPFEGKLVKDTAMHRVFVEAAGFMPQGRMVSFENDVELTIALLPREKATGTVAPALTRPPPPLKPR